MIEQVRKLQPSAIWNYFADITQIPHPSGYKDEICAYLIAFAQKQGLAYKQDEIGNILITKPATPGMENCKRVILQGHVDMVPQKNSGIAHNFKKDPLKLRIEGDWLKATDTTLGADNGIGVAAVLAVLASDSLIHGPVAALFTVEEETGMEGAFGLTPEFLDADILINTDSENEGELFVGCAGGEDVNASLTYKEDIETPVGDVAVKVMVSGLKGGHSGLDIHLGRANANKLLFRLLKDSIDEFDARLAWVDGGTLRNAIPREAVAVLTIPADELADYTDFIKQFDELYKTEYRLVDAGVSVTVEETEMPAALLPEALQNDLVRVVLACKNGVESMSASIDGVVETSSNLAIVKAKGGEVSVCILARGLVDSKKDTLCVDLVSLFELADFSVVRTGTYPGWNPDMNSSILKVMTESYEKLYNKRPKVNVIHAGLECGLIGAVNPALEMISFGPTMRYPHSPDEQLNIPTVTRFWDYLVYVLQHMT